MLLCPLALAAIAAAPLSMPPAAAPGAPTAPRRLLDRVAAVLDKQPLLLSEVELETRVALVQRSGPDDADKPLSDKEMDAALARAIRCRLALAEAERLKVFPPSDGEGARLMKAFADRFPSAAAYRNFLQRFEISESSVAALLQRDLRVDRYVGSRVKVRAHISDEDLRERYTTRPAAFDGLTFQEARERIRAEIARERYPELDEQLLAELRSRAQIRLAPSFANPLQEPAQGDARR